MFDCVGIVCACRAHARKLALENEALHDQVRQTEKDSVEVFGFLKDQDVQKDEQVNKSCYALNTLLVFRFNGTVCFIY